MMDALNLGYEFADESLLEEALTTPSFRMQHSSARDNQRLEFLGDAVLGLMAAERLYNEYREEQEGHLTVRRTHMVSSAALCGAAERLGLVKYLRRNTGASELPRGSKTLADAVEAIIGAAYVDGGLTAARAVFDQLRLTEKAKEGEWSDNPKGELQIIAQAMMPPRHPEYELIRTEGKAHAPIFTVRVKVDGMGSAEATAGSHKEAEAQAAAKLLEENNKNGGWRL